MVINLITAESVVCEVEILTLKFL